LNQHNLYNFNELPLIIPVISLPPIQFTSYTFRDYSIQ